MRTNEIRERADDLRAVEAAKLDAAADAIWQMVEAGDLRAQSVWLKNRGRYADLLGLDLRPDLPEVKNMGTFVIGAGATPDQIASIPSGATTFDCRLPWERGDTIDGEIADPPALPLGRVMTLAPIMRVEQVMVRYGIPTRAPRAG